MSGSPRPVVRERITLDVDGRSRRTKFLRCVDSGATTSVTACLACGGRLLGGGKKPVRVGCDRAWRDEEPPVDRVGERVLVCVRDAVPCGVARAEACRLGAAAVIVVDRDEHPTAAVSVGDLWRARANAPVGELQASSLLTLSPSASLARIEQLFVEDAALVAVPVVEGGRLVGLVTRRQLSWAERSRRTRSAR